MAAAYCYEGIPLRFLASLFDIQMRYLVYMRYLYLDLTTHLGTIYNTISLTVRRGNIATVFAKHLRQLFLFHLKILDFIFKQAVGFLNSFCFLYIQKIHNVNGARLISYRIMNTIL